LLTAKTDDESRLEGIEMGADAFLGKPFSPRELHSTVNNLLSLKSREGELAAVLEELQRTQSRMLESARMATIGQLATGLAHELRNPLNLTQGGAEHISELLEDLTRRSALDAVEENTLRRCLELIMKGGTRVDAIINRLHQLSESEDGTKKNKSILGDVISSISDFARLSDQSRNITIDTSCDENLITHISSSSLSQILLNLIMNAVYALNTKGGGTIWVHGERVASEQGDRVHLTVRDSGPGVPPDIRDDIFEPFITTKVEGAGTGIGLALSRQLVTDVGGTIELLDSEQGACFLVSIPAFVSEPNAQ
jgi:signal transduction histidine kinase